MSLLYIPLTNLYPQPPALVEQAGSAVVSRVSCRVSLFERQELPASLPAHGNNIDRGKTPQADDRNLRIEAFQTLIFQPLEGINFQA